MQPRKKKSRLLLPAIVLVLVGGALAAAFWPHPVLVDLGQVSRGAMAVTIDDEGRTQVRDTYIVSTPVAGQLQRVEVHPGDVVTKGDTVVAHMRPINPAALDLRTREQAKASVLAAEAALRVARADNNAALANYTLAESELRRIEQLTQRNVASQAAFDRQTHTFRVAEAEVETTQAAIAMREADLAKARAQLMDFDAPLPGVGPDDTGVAPGDIPLLAPADGRILRVMQESETTLPAGAPIMEIGNTDADLEVVVDLISSDAVQVAPGDPVTIDNWGGPTPLQGQVTRVDPFAVTKYSALGIEEQRVPVTIALTTPMQQREGLGHGYRVEVRIAVWQAADVLRVPASALFRDGADWVVFAVEGNSATLRHVTIGHNNGVMAEVTDGLSEGARVILYPSTTVSAGTRVAQRPGG